MCLYLLQTLLNSKLSDIHLKLDWVERLDLTTSLEPIVDSILNGKEDTEPQYKIETPGDRIVDDLQRETLFYRQAQSAIIEGLARLKTLGIPTKRPEDYFAQMAKSDDHMLKVIFFVNVLSRSCNTSIIICDRSKGEFLHNRWPRKNVRKLKNSESSRNMVKKSKLKLVFNAPRRRRSSFPKSSNTAKANWLHSISSTMTAARRKTWSKSPSKRRRKGTNPKSCNANYIFNYFNVVPYLIVVFNFYSQPMSKGPVKGKGKGKGAVKGRGGKGDKRASKENKFGFGGKKSGSKKNNMKKDSGNDRNSKAGRGGPGGRAKQGGGKKAKGGGGARKR
jgi:rRNA-processing protein EBP2